MHDFILPLICCFFSFSSLVAFEEHHEDISDSVITRNPSGTLIINQFNAQLTINNNLPYARWTLLQNNSIVYEGLGAAVNFQIPGGRNYRIFPEEIEGYSVQVNPSSFSLFPGERFSASIFTNEAWDL